MKYSYIFTLFFCLISLAAAVPVPGDSNGSDAPRKDKGKARAVDPPSQPHGRPHTPKPEDDPSVPLPGREGIYHDTSTNIVTGYYGDDEFPEHMGHLQRNHNAFPHNRNPMSLSKDPDFNRANALYKVPPAPRQRGTGDKRVRDEKMPALLDNPNHETSTTVEYLHYKESSKEGSLMSDLKDKIEEAGPNAQGQLRANPGWLPLNPDQRRGHELPARLRLNSPTRAPLVPAQGLQSNTKKMKKGPSRSRAEADTKKISEGYTPTAGQMTLRHREGKAEPSPSLPRVKRPARGDSNLQPGSALPVGHVWEPSSDGSKTPSHFDAPAQLKGVDQRYPPRPQNYDHYMKQLKAKKDEEAKHQKAVSQPPQAKEDLNKKFGLAKPGNGAGMAHEAPARMQSHPWHAQQPSKTHAKSASKPASSKSSSSNSKPPPNPGSSKKA